jgi:predicted Zn-dependent peptidase
MQYPEKMIESHTLKNGIRIVHKPDNSPVSYCGFAINAGTRDEEDAEAGMAHFIEHMLFKGTKKRKAWHIINRLEDVGGELNAYTTKEETFIYATVLSEDFERAMELCSDIVFNSVFPQQEIEKEVEVIIDEINSYNDSPSELIFDDFEDLIFKGYPIGKNILGNKTSLQRITTQDALDFVGRNYCTDQIVFFSLGNIPIKKIMRWAEKYMGDIPEKKSDHKRETPVLYVPQLIKTKKETYQTHTIIGNRAYSLADPQRAGLYLLNNILGGPGMNSRLNMALRERNGLAYNVESCYTAYSDTGIISIYFGTDLKNTEKSKHLIFSELKKLRTKKLTELQINKAKRQLLGQLAISQENKESQSLSLGKSFLYFNRFESIEDVYKRIEAITSEQLQDIANEIFDDSKISVLTFY